MRKCIAAELGCFSFCSCFGEILVECFCNPKYFTAFPFISVLKGSILGIDLLWEDVCAKESRSQSMPLLIWQDKAMYSPPLQGAAFAACATPHHLPKKDQIWLCGTVVWEIRQWAARPVKANMLRLNRDVLDLYC